MILLFFIVLPEKRVYFSDFVDLCWCQYPWFYLHMYSLGAVFLSFLFRRSRVMISGLCMAARYMAYEFRHSGSWLRVRALGPRLVFHLA